MRRRLWILATALLAAAALWLGAARRDHLRRARRRPPSVGRPRRPLRRHRHADPALQRLAALPDAVPHRRPLHGAVAETGTPAPSLARIWFADGPIDHDPAYHGGSCNVGGPYTGYPCASQNATGTPVPNPGWNGELTVPQTSDVGVVAITSASGLPTSYGTLAPIGTVDALRKKARNRNPDLTIVGYGAQDVKPVLVAVLERQPRVGRAARQEAEGHRRLERDVLRPPREGRPGRLVGPRQRHGRRVLRRLGRPGARGHARRRGDRRR